MDYSYGIAMGLHTLATVVWVGGMFFAHVVLGPASMSLALPQRLGLWRRVLPRFFAWVWVSIAVMMVTGYGVLLLGYRGGIAGGAAHVDFMQVTGIIMTALFVLMYFGPWHSFKKAVDAGDIVAAGRHQVRIRHVVTINLLLGLVTEFIGAAGSLLGT
jgi:uncharacterized membrane protein